MGAETSQVYKSPYGEYRIIVDDAGRKYRVGEEVKGITKRVGIGQGRRALLWGAWMCFFFGSVIEYGWGVASTTVIQYYGWNYSLAFFNYTVYVLFEATIIAYTYSWLREKGLISPRRTMLMAVPLVAVCYYFLAHSFAPWISYAGYAAIGGFGSGAGYATGGHVVTKWFPDKRGWRLGFADGAWAYGSVPFIIYYAAYFHTNDFIPVLYATGIILGIGMLIASFLVCDPPKYWWPKDVDPIAARKGKLKSRELKNNPPAVAQFETREFWASRAGNALIAAFTLGLCASLFNVGFYAPFGVAMGLKSGIVVFTVGAAGFAFTDGIGRPTMGYISTIIGRRRMFYIAYLIMGLGGLATLYAGEIHDAMLWAFFAVVSGAVSGACFVFALLIATDYYGENNAAKNWSSNYVFKVIGGAFAGIVAAAILAATNNWPLVFYLGAGFSLIGAFLIWAFVKQPTEEEYARIRQKLNRPVPAEIMNKITATRTEQVKGGDE